jgi:hypothetical protein
VKFTKAEARFEHPARGLDHCSECKHWVAPSSCAIVAGPIAPEDWCRHWTARNVRKQRHRTEQDTAHA